LGDERGYLFAPVKTPFRFNPARFPGLSYEIIYAMRKTGVPQHYTTFEPLSGGIVKIPTKF
jgi:hypothetical protein